MERPPNKRSDKEIIVLSLSLTYSIFVSVFAVIRLINEEWVIATLDLILALFGLYVFVHVWRTGNAKNSAYAIALISVIGTIATLALKGGGQIYWAYPSVALVFYLLPNKHALILWGLSSLIILFLLIDLPYLQLITIAVTVGITSYFCYIFSAKMDMQNARLRRIANEDVLTQVYNRRAFNKDARDLAHSKHPETAILLDLDKFKQVNDYFGHAKGDQVLKQVSQFIKEKLDTGTELYRIGGDEFAILCIGRDFNHAFQMAKKVHEAFIRFS